MKKFTLIAMLMVACMTAPLLTLAQSPRDNAAVTISFDGLVALFFGDSTKVTAGVLNAHLHEPRARIYKINAAGKQLLHEFSPAAMREPLNFRRGNTAPPTRYLPAEPFTDPNDFRWSIDMNALYNKRLAINREALCATITFDTGLFYGDKLSQYPVKFFDARGTGKMLPFNRKVSQVAGKIDLAAGEKVIVTGGQLTAALELTAGNVYSIEITNIPPDYSQMRVAHFVHYYDLLAPENNVERYMPFFIMGASAPPPNLCPVIVFPDETP